MRVWEDVRRLIDACDADGVARMVAELDEAERSEVARFLPRHLAEIRYVWDASAGIEEQAEAIRAAAVGCVASAAGVATWLTRRELIGVDGRVNDAERLLALIRLRPPEWRAELARRLAGRLRGRDPSYPLTAALLRETGVQPPTDDAFIVGWVSEVNRQRPLAHSLAADPLLDTLLPQIFRAEGVGEALQWEEDPASPYSWLGALRMLAANGRVGRDVLLDGCLTRFLLGGSAMQLRFFVRLHAALDPTAAETETRMRDYLRLLPSSPGTVANLALRQLRKLPSVPPADFAEAVHALMFRAEKKLVLAGLSWIDQLVRLAPEYGEPATNALVMAFGHEAANVQDRAVRLAVRHKPYLEGEVLRKGAASLPPDLRYCLLDEPD